MARAVQLDDFAYEVENPVVLGEVAVLALVRLDKFNVSPSAAQKIKPATGTPVPFHILADMNENKFGIHPRKFLLEYSPTAAELTNCTVANPKRYVEIPVLTIEQFNDTPIFDESQPSAGQDTAKITINHSADGNSSLTYNIIRKIPERLV
jgi:hypothetical protein